MTEREELILTNALEILGGADKPLAEAMIHALVQNNLGVAITVNELQAVLQLANVRGLATGLPGATGKMRWSLSDAGRHYLANK